MACNDIVAACICKIEGDHGEGPHHCACGGAWYKDEGSNIIRPVNWPGPMSDPNYVWQPIRQMTIQEKDEALMATANDFKELG